MKKMICILLTAALSAAAFCVYAEDENAVISVEVTPIEETVEDGEEPVNEDDIPEDAVEVSEEPVSDIPDEVTDAPAEEGVSEVTEPPAEEPEQAAEQPVEETEVPVEAEPEPMSVTDSDMWTQLSSMPGGRADSMYLNIAGELYSVGGIGENGYENGIYRYSGDGWTVETTVPVDIQGYTAAALGDLIYIIGGVRGTEHLKEVHVYNTADGTWSDCAPMNSRRSQAAAFSMGNKIYVFGGRDMHGIVSWSYEVYDPESGMWNTYTGDFAPALNRMGAQARYVNGFVCIYGGMTEEYEYGGAAFCNADDLGEVCETVFEGYEDISAAFTESKVLIFAANADGNGYAIKEAEPYNGTVTVTDAVRELPVADTYFTDFIVYNGELYCIGGYDGTGYLDTVYKYNEYYGDYSDQNGYISGEITDAGNILTLNAEAGKEYMFSVSVRNADAVSGYTYSLEYLPGAFELRDACAVTSEWERNTGSVRDTYITVTEASDGKVSFTTDEAVPDGLKMSGPVNAVILKANESGKFNIKYTMKKDQ